MEGVFFSNAAATPAKRPSTEMANGASKRRPRPPPPIVISPGQAAFRLLCHVSKIGGVIGKSGSIVKLFRQETGAKIRVEEAVPECDERVILVVAPENPKKKVRLSQQSLASSTEGEEVEVSAAQEALIRVFERVLEVEVETEGAPGGMATCKLLAATSQVGPVMGKGGKNIEKIRKESGAKIRVLAAEKIPACAAPSDELIQISGAALSVKKALVAVSHCLQENPPSEKTQTMSRAPVTVSHGSLPDIHGDLSYRSSAVPPTPGSSIDYIGRGRPVPTGGDRILTLDQKKPQQEVSFKLLCSNDKVGGVIGKGGTIVRALQNETGASISVGATIADSIERVITVSAPESPESRFSPAQNAIVRVFNRSVEAGMERGGESGLDNGPITARLLVPSSHIGCLMGKGGAIISEMRNGTGTCIRILGADKVPKCASENEEVVQITGELSKVQDALFHVTSRLRDNTFPAKISNGSGAGIYSSTLYGRHETNSPRMYSSLGFSHNIDRQTTLTHSMDHLGLSSNIDRPPSPTSWTSQTVSGVNSWGMTELGRGLAPTRGGIELGSGSKSAIVTNTTIEIVVPEHVMALVYGENGTNLSRMRQISGAKVIVRDPRPGAAEGMVIISGTPDQSQAAQSLLQAFILSGRTSPDPRSRLR